MPPSRRQGLSRPSAAAAPSNRRRDDPPPPSNRRTYGGGSSNRRRSRQQVEEEEEEEEEEEGQDADNGEEGEADNDGSRSEGVEDDDEADEREEGGEDDTSGVKKLQKLPLSDSVKRVVKGIGKVEINRKINDLVRLALFSEYRRVPIRRDDITKKVLGKAASRAFPYIFNKAQARLREVFCFELVEIRAKGTENEALTQVSGETEAKRAKKRAKKKDGQAEAEEEVPASTKVQSSKSYVVRSILPQAIIKAMSEPNATVAAAFLTNGERPSSSDTASIGALLNWQKADGQLGSLGLTFLILSLILLNGRTLSDDQFRALLHRLGLENSSQLPDSLRPDSLAIPPPELDASQSRTSYRRGISSSSNRRGGSGTSHATDTIAHPSTLQSLLNQMLRQGYLEIVKTNNSTGAVSRGSRGRASNGAGGDAAAAAGGGGEGMNAMVSIEWKWGPRAEVEIGEEAVASFIRDVYIDAADEDGGIIGIGGIGGIGGDKERGEGEGNLSMDTNRFVPRSTTRSVPPSGRLSLSHPQTQTQANTNGRGRGRSGLSEREERERREKRSELLLREIERAAGSQLVG